MANTSILYIDVFWQISQYVWYLCTVELEQKKKKTIVEPSAGRNSENIVKEK